MYARKLTKDELLTGGITKVTEDGRVFKGEEEIIPTVNKQGYFMHSIYYLDENGNKIRIDKPNSAFGYVYKRRSIGLHRVMWAWFHGEVPDGLIVDHISNKHSELKDYELSNLQLLTPKENTTKNRELSTREMPCRLDKPRSFYEDKLTQLTEEYEQAKQDKDAEKVHKLRTYLSQYRARLRYYDNHIKEFKGEA